MKIGEKNAKNHAGRGESYTALLEDADVKRWYDNIARGSLITADVRLRRLGGFCKTYDTTPQALAKMNEKEAYNMLMDLVSDMEKKGCAGTYAKSVVTVIKSWLAHNDITVSKKITIRDVDVTSSLKEERVPTQEELQRVFAGANPQARAACVLFAHSGVRPQVLGNYEGNDGLKLSNIPELKIEKGEVTFEKMPAIIIIESSLSKAGHRYFSFLSEEGCQYIKEYIEERIRAGEEMTPDTPIITPKVRSKPFISTANIGDTVRKALRGAGLEWRPYVLRAYFDTQLMLAESKGKVLRDYRTFWMGHKGDIEHTYTVNKSRLPPNIIEDMRGAYKRSQEFLQTRESGSPKEDNIKEMFRKQLLCVAGYTDEEIEKMNPGQMSDEDIKKKVRERLVGKIETEPQQQQQQHKTPSTKPRQKIVSMNDIDSYLTNGWQFVTTLPDQRVVIQAAFNPS